MPTAQRASAVISKVGHWPSKSRSIRGRRWIRKRQIVWDCGKEPPSHNPYQVEWDDLIAAVKEGKSYNEVERGTKAALVTAMGRFACHTGQKVTYDEMLNNSHAFAPDVDKLTMDSSAPIQADKDGKYPVPQPGITTNREYA